MNPKLPPVALDKLPENVRSLVEADLAAGRDPAMNAVLAHAPEFFARYFAFYYPAHEQGALDARIKELARLRIARINSCRTCGFARYASATRQGLDEARIAQLDLPAEERDLEPREQAAVEFAERMAVDHNLVDDAFVTELRKHFTPAQILELGMMIGQYLGFGRLLVVLGIHDHASKPYVAGLDA
jgi:AhpD family alkylhydroperoxidase